MEMMGCMWAAMAGLGRDGRENAGDIGELSEKAKVRGCASSRVRQTSHARTSPCTSGSSDSNAQLLAQARQGQLHLRQGRAVAEIEDAVDEFQSCSMVRAARRSDGFNLRNRVRAFLM